MVLRYSLTEMSVADAIPSTMMIYPNPTGAGSGEPKSRNSLEVAAVSRQERRAVAGHDAGNQTIRHPDGVSAFFEQFTNLTCGIGGGIIQMIRRDCFKQFLHLA